MPFFVSLLQDSWLAAIITVIGGYLLGSFNTAIIVTRLRSGTDIRDYGSGNAGATNVLRSQGAWPAAITMAGDLLKSILAVVVGYFAFRYLHMADICATEYATTIGRYLGGFASLIGHLFPVYFGFRGGKGVVVTLGMTLILDWRVALLSLATFIIVVAIWKMVSLGSCIAGVVLVILTGVFKFIDTNDPFLITFCTIAMGIVVGIAIIKHVPNIKRIIAGTESKVSFKKKG